MGPVAAGTVVGLVGLVAFGFWVGIFVVEAIIVELASDFEGA